MLYDSDCITFWRRQSYGDSKKISVFSGISEEEDMKSTDIKCTNIRAGETILNDTLMMDTCHYTIVKTLRMYKQH